MFDNLKNLKDWAPIIWKDRNWDYKFFLDILLKKLKNMEKFFSNDEKTHVENAQIYANQMREVIGKIERFLEDDYETIIDPNFLDWITEDRPLSKEVVDETGEVHYYFNSPDWDEEELAHRREVYKKAEEMRQKDIDDIFSIIAKNIRDWWD